tara:strand:+ start:404 stop:574 length:171 start_codon:yes stop_codon:yes gene_type:complete
LKNGPGFKKRFKKNGPDFKKRLKKMDLISKKTFFKKMDLISKNENVFLKMDFKKYR